MSVSSRSSAASSPPVRERAAAIRVAFAALVAWASGCTAQAPGDLRERLWTCATAADCVEGWGCADGSAVADDFCRPVCDPDAPASCDGVCTPSGECLAGCRMLGDETSRCPEGHTCIRTDLLGDEGVCFPVEGCSRSDECGPDTRCLNDVLGLPAVVPGVPYAADHLYCIAVPDAEGRCPTGYMTLPAGASEASAGCVPRCDRGSARCPPDLTCLEDLGYLFGQPGASPCYAGLWELPCDDDAQCLVGRCLEVGGGRRACTLPCADADRVFGGAGRGCARLADLGRGLRLDALRVSCEAVGEGSVCVPWGTAGAPCNDDMLCDPRLECRAFVTGVGLVRLCSRDCAVDGDCAIEGAPITAYCQRSSGRSNCLPRSDEGGACTRTGQCRVGLVCVNARCAPAP